MIKILIVDDHDLMRNGLTRILDDVNDLNVVGEANCGEQGIELARQLQPDVVLMDVKMPGMGGLEATRCLAALNTAIKVIAVTSSGGEFYPSRLLQAGASAYVTKKAHPDEVIKAIRMVILGEIYVSQEIAQQLAVSKAAKNPPVDSPFEDLSDREVQIAMMTIRGEKASTIAERLNVSSKTINTYRYRIFEKFGINSDVELVHFAIKHRIFDVENLE
ncbi:MAG: response regulator [Cellvibrionaceae bacterium]|nr:response regulator [Cellvibrionaceae bacterium]